MSQQHLSEQELIRRDKLNELKQLGIDPYPAPLYPVSHYSEDIKAQFTEETKEQFSNVTVAGRIMTLMSRGKVFFIKIQDNKGIIQLYVKRDDICPGEDKSLFDNLVKRLIDLGDFIGVTGSVFITHTGETTVHANTFTLLAKSLKPLPVVKRDEEGNVFDAVTDPEFRYRQRYADLVINPDVKDTFLKRTKIVNTIRDFLNEQGALEVDTPVLQAIPGGAAARPFTTHHNALDIPFYLRIANELYLKRLIVGGFDWVYEFSRNFRNEGMDRTHNPEFTVLEWYTAYKDYFWMMEVTEKLFERLAIAIHGTTDVKVGENIISFKAPFKRISILDSIKENTGIDVSEMDEEQLRATCKQLKIDVKPGLGKGKLIDELFGNTSEHTYVQPTFITDYPVEMSPLTKKHREKAGLVERFELMVNGKEIANAYSELNDPIDQRERFEEQVKLMERGDDEAMYIDHDFLRALEYGMPPTSGIGIGIDRLVMLLTNQPSIQDVLFFPQMRPENNQG
ncbi:lysyl-tRNA synthetase, class II [Filimonas lacunae]|uniref:Lysine--tRNA ligase n=1 Tax=Filimonas lacunae TaxID=477680 RepID=A0A173MQB9_9BACT|nr:lysine--tRNA ligase [Filimonas lacunae]BAV09875.1 lysyl-tRNA synthetase class II [Filimonas lacunae]SIS80334.1 lysyl-tRNA synthetase, class II [Filimonas lacunae]